MRPAPSDPVVRLVGATVVAGAFTLGPLDLEVAAGTVHVVLANGAGKTTLLDLVVGLAPDDGTVEVEGRVPDPDDTARYRRLRFAPTTSARSRSSSRPELWALCARLHARVAGDPAAMTDRAGVVADRLRFDPPPYPLRAHSHGMRRKAQLVAPLLHDPPLVVLGTAHERPRPAVSPRPRHLLGERAEAEGATALVTTHDLLWALRFADVLTLMADGEIRFDAPPSELVPADTPAARGGRLRRARRRAPLMPAPPASPVLAPVRSPGRSNQEPVRWPGQAGGARRTGGAAVGGAAGTSPRAWSAAARSWPRCSPASAGRWPDGCRPGGTSCSPSGSSSCRGRSRRGSSRAHASTVPPSLGFLRTMPVPVPVDAAAACRCSPCWQRWGARARPAGGGHHYGSWTGRQADRPVALSATVVAGGGRRHPRTVS